MKMQFVQFVDISYQVVRKKREELIEIETYEENEYNTITNGYIFNDISYNLEFQV